MGNVKGVPKCYLNRLGLAPPVFLKPCLRDHSGRPSADGPWSSHPAALTALPPGQLCFHLLYVSGVLHELCKESSVVKRYGKPQLYLTGHHLKGTQDSVIRGSWHLGFSHGWMPWERSLRPGGGHFTS